MARTSAALPLAGIRVLDLTSVIMGPACTQILGQYGADILKVEPPAGDIMRHAGARRDPGMGAMFLHVNHHKQSAVIDLKHPDGAALVRELAGQCDVFVHNIREDAIRRLGLDYESVRARRPDMIYAALTGYAEDGPYAGRPAFDDIIQAQTGVPALYAEHTGEAPAYLPALIADRYTGTAAAHRIVAQLFHRQRTGEGGYLNVSMFETLAEFTLSDHLGGLTFDAEHGAPYYSRLMTRYRRPYRTLDGYVAVLVYNDKHWQSFLTLTGDTDKLSDTRFTTAAGRAGHYDLIYTYLEGVIASRTTADWIATLGSADIPCTTVNTVPDLVEDPHLEAIGFLPHYRHSQTGTVYRAINKNVDRAHSEPPIKGQHTVQALADWGVEDARIQALLNDSVIHDGRTKPA
ncbi:CoA transferase [Pusillimonas sp. TS35]|uniref:CaiB/BaiF CoA transferase family protein n=1 Tax=Paracandidimonas lactea TaxID=2895524 RepID=UPI001367D671|nr:CoA transferase [Paracandidimonas lactea]MYN14271.1 CoA transferase [Pusillimonas sp. TS35]